MLDHVRAVGIAAVTAKPLPLQGGARHTSVVQVRKDSVAAFVDGRLAVRHATDYSDLGMPENWSLGQSSSLGIGCNNTAARFFFVELIEVASADKAAK